VRGLRTEGNGPGATGVPTRRTFCITWMHNVRLDFAVGLAVTLPRRPPPAPREPLALGRNATYLRTATPAAARCSFASATRYVP
jgi:hypothetical protein